ncbi:MAG: glycosyltransferase [Flavobacteriales bacterium]|nr:glycosyltransferase [Flavobacteriales bacterium]
MRIANVVLNDFTRDNRVLKVSQSLAEDGHDVTVVALHKEGLPMSEQRTGWRVVRTRVRTAALPRGTVFGVVKMAELALRVVWKWRKVEAWHCNDIEAFVLGWCAQRLNPRLKLIYDCHEFEAERNAKPAIERKLVGWLERRMIRKAAAVITVSPSIAEAYRERYASFGLPEVHLVRNIPAPRPSNATQEGMPPDHFRARFGIPQEAFIALYQGAFTYNRGLEMALAAMEGISDSGIHLVLMGYGPLQALVDETAARLPHVHVHPAVPYEEVLEHTRSADVGLVSVKPTCLSYRYCLPNKLFEYILAGVPVLSNDLPDCRALIETFGVGSIVAQDDAAGWQQALQDLHQGGTTAFAPGLERAAASLSWGGEAERLCAVYREVSRA